MGNAFYRRVVARSDATGATVQTIPCGSSGGSVAGGTRAGGGHISSSKHHYTDQSQHHPQFRRRHASCGTEDDPAAPFFAIAQHQLLRHVNIVQFQFALFTLCIWNYLSTIRFVFGSDAYGDKIPPSTYVAWMLDGSGVGGGGGDASSIGMLPSASKGWMALLYLASCVGGLVGCILLVLYIVWNNRPAAFELGPNGCRETCGGNRVYLHRPVFMYTRRTQHKGVVVSACEAYQALDAHAAYHSEYGDDARGDVAPLLLYVGYFFAFPLAIIDIGVAFDLTLNVPSQYANTSSVAGEDGSSSSYGAPKVGEGLSALQAITMIILFLYVLLPPRRWYQTKAEAYLAARYY